jgi:hypothetical protein
MTWLSAAGTFLFGCAAVWACHSLSVRGDDRFDLRLAAWLLRIVSMVLLLGVLEALPTPGVVFAVLLALAGFILQIWLESQRRRSRTL